ncbi:MAG: beta-galactosidase [Chloroflexi bacterium]|nr:beta-galactosidase [Chloroflexota bacterium]
MQYDTSPSEFSETPIPSPNRKFVFIGIAAFAAVALVVCCIGIVGIAYWQTDGFAALTTSATETPTRVARVNATPTNAPNIKPTAPPPASTPGTAPTKKPPPTETPEPTATPAPIPKIKSPKMNSPEFGAQAFLWWRPETADRDLGLARAAGFTWVKQSFSWRDIEGAKKGAFDWSNADRAIQLANAKGIDILARMDNAPEWAAPGCFNAAKKTMGPAKNQQDWVDFLKAFVTRYKGRVRAIEIWNEPNLAREWCNRPPNPTEYATLLKISYQTIKAIDPNIMIISAGMTPTTRNDDQAMPDALYIERMYTAMGNKSDGYFDVLGVHAPGFKAPPEMSPDDVGKNPTYNNNEGAAGRIYSFRHVEDIRKIMVAKGDSAKQIAILEFGWTMDPIHPEYSWFKVDEQTHGKYVEGAYQYAKKNWAPWIGAMFVIYFANPDWTKDNEEYWWSITDPEGNPRAAYIRVKALPK